MKKEDILNKIKNTRLLAAIGLGAMFIGTFLPYLQTSILWSSVSLPLWRYWQGKVTVLLIIANAIFIFKDYIEKYIPSLLNIEIWKKISEIKNSKMSLIPTGISLVLLLWLTMDLGFDFRMYGLGFYVLWLGVICLVAYAIINKGNVVVNTSINNNINNNLNNVVNPNMNQNNNSMNNYNNGMNPNMNQNYNNMNNYNNGINPNMNQNYNNMNNYNNEMNPNMNQNNNNMNNYNNAVNPNMNPNYNNTASYNTNQNNIANNNVNSNYNNMNSNDNVTNFNENQKQ